MDKLKNLKRIFNSAVFRIPDYQRGYSWGDNELIDLWDDLYSLLPSRDHYTGMLSLQLVNRSDIEKNTNDLWTEEQWISRRGDNVYEIVDGQQRLTTLIILINEIVNYCKKNNLCQISDTKIEDIKNTYLFEDKPSKEPETSIITTYKFGYNADNPSYDYFRNHILNEQDDINAEKTLYTKNLHRAKEFFKKRLELLSEDEVEELFNKITQHLMFNIHEIEDNFNVFVAFETMNNRGKRLSTLELLKNRLIYLTTLFSNDEDEKEKVRKQIIKTWKDIYSYLGENHAFRLEDDDYLRLHWIIYFGFNTRKDQGNKTITFSEYLLKKYFVQQRINNNITSQPIDDPEEDTAETGLLDEDSEDDNEEDNEIGLPKTTPINEQLKLSDIKNYVESLDDFVPFWHKTYTAEGLDEELSKYIFRLNTLSYVNARPLVTVLLHQYSMTNPSLILECTKKIERFNFLTYGIDAFTTTYMNSTFYNLAHNLYYHKTTIEKILKTLDDIYCLSSNNVIKTNGPLERFEKLFKRDGFYSWPVLKYLLYIYDIKNKNIPAEQTINPKLYFAKDKKDKYTVEHIYPQKANNAYWTKWFTLPPKECKILSSSLGNLLPLSGIINSTLQNKAFTEKKKRYENGSSSEREVANWKGGNWKPQCILDRGMRILSFMETEFDFKFPNDLYRKRLLGLEFMAKKKDNETNAIEPELTIKKTDDDKEVFSEQSHLNGCSDNVLSIYKQLETRLLELENMSIEPQKSYIAFKHNNSNVCDIQTQGFQIKIAINCKTGELDDPKGLTRNMETPRHIGHFGNGDYEVILTNPNDIDYIIGLIKQSYNIH